jgi:hypothetical protein
VQISFVYNSLKRALDQSLFWPCSDGRWSPAYEAKGIAQFIANSPQGSTFRSLE